MGVVYTVSPSWIPLPFVEAIAMALLPAPDRHMRGSSRIRFFLQGEAQSSGWSL
jgi:hypothetical protein